MKFYRRRMLKCWLQCRQPNFRFRSSPGRRKYCARAASYRAARQLLPQLQPCGGCSVSSRLAHASAGARKPPRCQKKAAVAANERRRMEDAVDIKDDVAGFRLFTVYDGHAGDEAVTVVKKILPDIVGTHLQEEEDVKKAICLAFSRIDEELTKTLLAAPDTPSKVKVSSSTVASMALIKGKTLKVCNLGDCRAVLCSGGTKAHAVSKDHAADKNAAEAERLRKLGVPVKGGYVGDHVAVSRAFGNVEYDSGKKVEGIISEPDIFKIEVDDELDFLILASDGIWDPLKDQFAVTHARKALRTTEQPEDAAKAVLQNAAKISAADNAAAIVVVFKFPEPLPKRSTRPRATLAGLDGPPR